MKKIISIVLAIMMALSFAHSLYAASDGGPDIIIMPASLPETPVPNRGIVPISAYYDAFTASIVVSFNSNIGDVITTITNQYSGESYGDTINAYCAPVYMPISGTEGLYTITFELANGDEYYGVFAL